MDQSSINLKYEALRTRLRSMSSVITAFSGGIDSSLVAYAAHQELGAQALAVTSASPSLKREDLELTKILAAEWGLQHRIIQTEELNNPDYLKNPSNRCYFCKTDLYRQLSEIAQREGYRYLVNGTNLDDLTDYRPGLKAAQEHQVFSPLVECAFQKADIRQLAHVLKLRNADKPQAACLSSRVPYGTSISPSLLEQIQRAETVLSRLGFTQFRVRHHDEIARLEIMPQEFALALQQHALLEKRLRQCGYLYVTLDLGGFRSGSLNDSVDIPQKPK